MMHNESITEQLHSLTIGKYSSKELTENYIHRIKQLKHLNCFISVLEESALQTAADADQARLERERRDKNFVPDLDAPEPRKILRLSLIHI
mgnify:CR=1 FL=1